TGVRIQHHGSVLPAPRPLRPVVGGAVCQQEFEPAIRLEKQLRSHLAHVVEIVVARKIGRARRGCADDGCDERNSHVTPSAHWRVKAAEKGSPARATFWTERHIPSSFDRKARRSAHSSMIFDNGLPAPWPARVSMRIRAGRSPDWAACSVAAYLKLWPGT